MSNSGFPNPDRPPTLAITPGEPAGIGPDLALMLGAEDLSARVAWVVDPELLQTRAALLGRAIRIEAFSAATGPHRGGCFAVLPATCPAPVQPGRLDARNARYVLQCLDLALEGCLGGSFDALVTGPVQKSVINEAGVPFTGHTEYLAAAAGHVEPVMMLATETLRVALATTHIPLAAVPRAITRERVAYTLGVVAQSLRTRFGVETPRIGVCGLNPHAGESGHMGREEIDVIEPVLARLRGEGYQLSGPLPADTAFTPAALAECDAVVAMYHDQGLAPLKALGFGHAVNITLGLPFIRTSVDHGTALSLAGTGSAQVTSLRTAFDLALLQARQRRRESAPLT